MQDYGLSKPKYIVKSIQNMSKELLELTIGALAKAAGVNLETVRY